MDPIDRHQEAVSIYLHHHKIIIMVMTNNNNTVSIIDPSSSVPTQPQEVVNAGGNAVLSLWSDSILRTFVKQRNNNIWLLCNQEEQPRQ
jgi:hypothetical protein